jgi:HK97 gp10 family phage protein
MANVNGFEITKDNTKEFLEAAENATEKILTMIGMKAEGYAKRLCPVGTAESTGIKGYRGGTLRNSITYKVESEGDKGTVAIGSNVEYAPYVELGTGPYFEPPPSWETFEAERGAGIKKGGYVKARKFLRPAIENHISEYQKIIKNELKNG